MKYLWFIDDEILDSNLNLRNCPSLTTLPFLGIHLLQLEFLLPLPNLPTRVQHGGSLQDLNQAKLLGVGQ